MFFLSFKLKTEKLLNFNIIGLLPYFKENWLDPFNNDLAFFLKKNNSESILSKLSFSIIIFNMFLIQLLLINSKFIILLLLLNLFNILKF